MFVWLTGAVSVRPGRMDTASTQPDQRVGDRVRTGVTGQPRVLGRVDIPAGGLAIHPCPGRDLPQPLTLQPGPQPLTLQPGLQHLTHLDHTDLPESHPR